LFLIEVALPINSSKFYTYIHSAEVDTGTIVLCPVRNKNIFGIVISSKLGHVDGYKSIKDVTEIKITQAHMTWLLKAAEYYMCTAGELVSLTLEYYAANYVYSFYKTASNKISSISECLSTYGKRIFDQKIASGELVPTRIEFNEGQYHSSREIFLFYNINMEEIITRINQALQSNKQVLLIAPEFYLTNYFAGSMQDYLKFVPHLWSQFTNKHAKHAIWSWAMSGEIGLIIGSRSSLWLPYQNLGLIIVIQEHDFAYKNKQPSYHARDVAVLRAYYEGCECILTSNSPSIETWKNCISGKYKLITGKMDPGNVQIDFIQNEVKWLNNQLIEQIDMYAKSNLQVIIFINQRGFAASVICESCTEVLQCSQCSAALHFYENEVVQCSHCKLKILLSTCACGASAWYLKGLGIDLVFDRMSSLFPSCSIVMLKDKNLDYQSIINADIIITNNVIPEIYRLSRLRAIFWLNCRISLLQVDPRGVERFQQAVVELSRLLKPNSGKLLIQVSSKSSDTEAQLFDYSVWVNSETERRQYYLLPPFYRLIRFIFMHKVPSKAKDDAQYLYEQIKSIKSFETFRPTEAQLFRYCNYFRYQLLVIYKSEYYPQNTLMKVIVQCQKRVKSNLVIDVDPYSFV